MKPMISLTTTAETEFKQLDKDKASILWELLGLLIAPEYDDFFDGSITPATRGISMAFSMTYYLRKILRASFISTGSGVQMTFFGNSNKTYPHTI